MSSKKPANTLPPPPQTPPPNPIASASPPRSLRNTFSRGLIPIVAVRDAVLPAEVEVTLRLPDNAAHSRVVALLAPFRRETLRQENFYFDGCECELSSQRAVLLFRFFDCRNHCLVYLKSKAVLVDGISRFEGDEEEIDSSMGLECVAEPEKLGSLDSRILKRCKDEFMVKGFVGLGGFANVRDVFYWKGLKLEVDETSYDFGTCYEIECETSDPEGTKKLMEDFLKENGIEYKYSEASKFAVFRSGKLP